MNNKIMIGISLVLVVGMVYTLTTNLETQIKLQKTEKELEKSKQEIKNFQEIIPLIRSGGLDVVKEATKHSEPILGT